MKEDGVWRTIRGRRIFIGKGEDLTTAMKNSGKFNDNGRLPKREDVMKGKKELKRQEAVEKWHKEYAPGKYKSEDYQDPKKRALMDKRKEKVDKEFEKTHKEKDDFMELYDKDRPDEEMTWQDRVERNNREARRKAEQLRGDRENDAYYQTFRDNEERNARIKEEPDDAPYEPIDAHKGYMDKFSKHSERDTWTGKEYTNDEFMEHLTDANWHHERKMIEEAGLTNKQMTELKNQVKLSKWSAELDKDSTQALIDKVKKEFPAKEQKIADYKDKKQSNNKVDTSQRVKDNKIVASYGDNVIYQNKEGNWITSRKNYNDYVSGKSEKIGGGLILNEKEGIETLAKFDVMDKIGENNYVKGTPESKKLYDENIQKMSKAIGYDTSKYNYGFEEKVKVDREYVGRTKKENDVQSAMNNLEQKRQLYNDGKIEIGELYKAEKQVEKARKNEIKFNDTYDTKNEQVINYNKNAKTSSRVEKNKDLYSKRKNINRENRETGRKFQNDKDYQDYLEKKATIEAFKKRKGK